MKKELEELEEDLQKRLLARRERRNAVVGAVGGPLLGKVTNLKNEIQRKISTVETIGCLRTGAVSSLLF